MFQNSYCYFNNYILFDTTLKKNNLTYIINESHEDWIHNTTSSREIIFKNIKNIELLYKEYPECKDKIIYQIENEKLLTINVLKLYHKSLEQHLLNFLNHHENYKKDKIIEDFIETKDAILESIDYLYNYIIIYILKDNKNQNFKKQIQFDIKYWHQTYYILTFELFYQLPREFKKEWFKKFKL